MISIYLGPHYFFQAPEELRWLATTITGPNDASGVVWASGMFFFCFSSCFLLLANDFYLFRSSLFFSGTRRATVAGDDHNRPKRCIWRRLGPGMFVFCFSSCFLLLANDFYLFRSSLFLSGTRRAMVAGDDHNRPKRRQMRRLGLRYVFFFSSCFFFTK